MTVRYRVRILLPNSEIITGTETFEDEEGQEFEDFQDFWASAVSGSYTHMTIKDKNSNIHILDGRTIAGCHVILEQQ